MLLNTALSSGWSRDGRDLAHYVHAGRAYVNGRITAQTNGAQAIFPAGTITDPPLGAVHVNLWPCGIGYSPQMPMSTLYRPYPSTVYPDGSWSLDAPVSIPTWTYDYVDFGFPGLTRSLTWPTSVTLVLYASWPLQDQPDDPTGWGPLPTDGFVIPWETPVEFTNSGAELVRHVGAEDLVHLRGNVTAVDDSSFTIALLSDADFPVDVPRSTTIPVQTPFGMAGVEVAVEDPGTSLNLIVPTRLHQGQSFTNPAGVYNGGDPSHTGDTPPWTRRIGAHEEGGIYSGIAFETSYAIYDLGPIGSEVGPCVYDEGPFGHPTMYFPGALRSPEPLPDVDLAAVIATMPIRPDWVTIQFLTFARNNSVSENVGYYGFSGCPTQAAYDAGAEADLIGNVVRYEPRVSGHYHPAHISFSNTLVDEEVGDGAHFGTSDGGAFPGDITGSNPRAYNTGTFSHTEGFMLPPTVKYSRRGLVEDVGHEWSRALWDPDDVTTGTCDVHGLVQYLKLGWAWVITGYWDVGDQYIVDGDVVSLGGGYPAPSTPPSIAAGEIARGVRFRRPPAIR